MVNGIGVYIFKLCVENLSFLLALRNSVFFLLAGDVFNTDYFGCGSFIVLLFFPVLLRFECISGAAHWGGWVQWNNCFYINDLVYKIWLNGKKFWE